MAARNALDPANFAIGVARPQAVHAPATAEELAAQVRDCAAAGAAIVFFGGGTLQSLGAPPTRYDVAISLGRLARIVAYDHRDMTIAVEGGTTLAQLDATLAERGQFVPLDAPRATHATAGGTLASGWLGPRRTAYGRPRDFTIGTTVALADGTLARAGGMVVKNATGYDLSKLHLGALGGLGAIVRANLRTLPLPAARRIALAPLPERTHDRALANLRRLAIEPAAALVVRGFRREIDGEDGEDGRAFVLLEGSPATIERATREVRSALGAAGVPETRLIDRDIAAAFARLVDAYVAMLGTRSVTYRSLGLPDDGPRRRAAFADAAREHALTLETIEDAASGDVVARVSTRAIAHFAPRIAAFDAARSDALANARVLAGPPALRGELRAWGDAPPALAAMRAVKARFDPVGILAPGRCAGGL